MLKIGDTLPSATVYEYIEVEGNGCSLGPNAFDVAKACAGKKIAIFALPGAYTPTCSAQHVPSYLKDFDALMKLLIQADDGNPVPLLADFILHRHDARGRCLEKLKKLYEKG